MTGTVWDRIVADVVEQLESIGGDPDASTVVDLDSVADQKVLNVASTTGFVAGFSVMINHRGGSEEVGVVASIQAGESLTLRDDLELDHLAADKHSVKQRWWNTDAREVRTWGPLRLGRTGDWAALSFVPGEERLLGYLAPDIKRVRREFVLHAWIRARKDYPEDQENDALYQGALADCERALMTDHTRGGNVEDTRINSSRPIPARERPDEMREVPLIGVEVRGHIDYRHKVGDLYTK